MPSFGYSIHKDRQIRFDELDRRFYQQLKELEPSVDACISCGTCASTCSTAQYTEFSLRRCILLLRRGETKEVEARIHNCMLCGKCQLLCPMGVNTRNVLFTIMQLFDSKQTK